MEWSAAAAEAIRKVPFFVRKRVRTRVENEAREAGKHRVSLADVKATQARYLTSMSSEIKGYQVDACFGPNGCPNRAHTGSEKLLGKIEALFKEADMLGFLKSRVRGGLKFHHEFRVSLADCPNGCSQPQIKDIGIIAAACPSVTEADCSNCASCVDECREHAVTLADTPPTPVIDHRRCLACGRCVAVCPTGSLATGRQGFRIQLGGKLGRHPRLAMELPGIYSESQVLDIVRECIRIYKSRSREGQRFSALVGPSDVEQLATAFPPLHPRS